MKPYHASTLDAITAIVRRHYLRPVTLTPTPGDPDHWSVSIPDRTAPVPTEVILRDGRYTFQDRPTRPVPQWDREIA